jgi:hypothetical protein
MQGHGREDHMTDMGEVLNGCGKQDGMKVDKPKEDEGIGRGKLRRMGMMGRWIEVGTHLS